MVAPTIKRIGLKDLKAGMFIEEIELPPSYIAKLSNEFYVSEANVAELATAPVSTLVINIQKGTDVSGSSLSGQMLSQSQFISSLRRHFSGDAIRSARTAIEVVVLTVKQIVNEARLQKVFNRELAQEVVSGLMTEVISNSGALPTMAKLKCHDEVTFQTPPCHRIWLSSCKKSLRKSRACGKDQQLSLRPPAPSAPQ